MKSGILILVMGPTGSGKGTLMRHAMEAYPTLTLPYSYTTRPPRDGVEGKHYRFVTVGDFEERKNRGEFLEWAKFGDHYYGTLKEEVLADLEAGRVLLKEVELQGARQVIEMLPKEKLCTVFIDAGSWEELAKRARSRAPISDEELQKRYERYQDEITFKEQADAVIDNSGETKEVAIRQFSDLIESIVQTHVSHD